MKGYTNNKSPKGFESEYWVTDGRTTLFVSRHKTLYKSQVHPTHIVPSEGFVEFEVPKDEKERLERELLKYRATA